MCVSFPGMQQYQKLQGINSCLAIRPFSSETGALQAAVRFRHGMRLAVKK